jgi:hypothetical protein
LKLKRLSLTEKSAYFPVTNESQESISTTSLMRRSMTTESEGKMTVTKKLKRGERIVEMEVWSMRKHVR